MQVEVIFLGEPRLVINKERKHLGKQKLEALLYYLLFYEEADRSETASVFWPHYDTARARASLRNSLYQIRELLGADLFSSSSRDRIILSPHVQLIRDVDLLLAGANQMPLAEGRAPVFLHNRELKNNAAYEAWLLSVRATYQRILTHNLRDALDQARQQSSRSAALDLARQILELEPYDEATLRLLMEQYSEEGRHNEALASFQQMKKLLSRELGVEPEPETIYLAERIRDKKLRADGRFGPAVLDPRRAKLDDAWRRFQEGPLRRHVMILGEPGSGSHSLIEAFLKTCGGPFAAIRLDPAGHEIAGSFSVKWTHAFQGRPEADFSRLRLVLPQERVICVIYDLENLDRTGLSELADFLMVDQDRIFFILNAAPGLFSGDDLHPLTLLSAGPVRIEVPLLSREELRSCLESDASDHPLTERELSRIHGYCGGSVLLAEDYLRPQGQAEKLFVRLLAGVDKEERKLLEAICVFPDQVTPVRADLHGWTKSVLMDRLRTLCAKGILVEDQGAFSVRYPPLRRFIYDRIPAFYRAYLHELAAEKDGRPDQSPRQKAADRAWHWQKAGDQGRALYYALKESELKLDFYDLIYPAWAESSDQPDHYLRERQRSYAALDSLIGAAVDYRETTSDAADTAQLERLVRYLSGRRLIAGGRREEGIIEIDELIRQAGETGDREYLLKGYIQRVHYGIQKEDLDIMGHFVCLALDQTEHLSGEKDQRERAEVLRLSGLYKLKRGEYAAALKQLEEADRILKAARYRHNGFLARAAGLSYIADTRQALGDVYGADQAWCDAIALVEGRLHKCLDTLYADYGRFLYKEGRIQEAKQTLHRALEEYQILGTHWKRPMTEAILGLIALDNKEVKSARVHLVSAQIYHKADRRPGEEVLISLLQQRLGAAGGPVVDSEPEHQ